MSQVIVNFLMRVFKSKYIATLFVAMFPLIELKGAIPIGIELGINNLFLSAGISYVGSTVISVLEFFLLLPIFNLLKKIGFVKKLILKVEGIFTRKAEEIAKKTNGKKEDEARKIMMWSLFVFVAVPFPVTGVWTGTAIAVFLGLKFRESLLPIAVGNLVAGTIITLLTFFFKAYVDIIIYVLFGIAIIMLIVFILKIILSKPAE